jgi:hypothetical protein
MHYNNLKFTVAEVSRMFEADKDTVKTWAYKFSEYLTANANPPKGIPREFQLEDIRIMAYVFSEWEDDPDIECIKMGLNSNNHYENPNIDDLISSLIPLFIDPPENMDENWKHGVIFSGFATLGDILMYARSYKLAGDRLIDIALENEEAWDLHNPALFNYRHSIELYLKTITGSYKHEHNLLPLYRKLKKLLKTEFNAEPPEWFESVILKFNEMDPGGITFRYGGIQNYDEVFIDFIQMKKKMGWLTQSFQNILNRRGITY